MKANIAHTLLEVVARQRDKVAIVEAKSGRKLSFGEIEELASRYAAYLQKNGVQQGDRVMLMVSPSADFICLTFALFMIGAPVILIDPGMGYKNLLRCVAGVKPRIFVGIPKAHLFRRIFPAPFKTVKKSFCCGSTYGLFGRDIRRAAMHYDKQTDMYDAAPDDLAAIIFTTGSTGPPKGVRYDHGIFAAQLRLIREHYGIVPGDIDQPAFPLFALFSTALGATAIIPDMNPSQPAKVDPEKFIRSINDYHVSYSFGSPAIWNVVANYCLAQKIQLVSLKKVLMAGAPVSGELIGRVKAILGEDGEIHTPYGATESLPIVSMQGDEILSSTWEKSRRGKGTCVGRPLPGITIKILRTSDKPLRHWDEELVLSAGDIGEIVVQGDVVTPSYINNPEETALAKIEDNGSFWHRMGDVGYMDDQDRLWFCGRRGHRVVTEKGTMYTIPCEAIINEHPDVYRSALVGIPHATLPDVQIPVMIVEMKKHVARIEEDLLAEVGDLAKNNALTNTIEKFLLHQEFPVDIRHNAKIFREKLSVWAAEKIRV